jgi:Zn-finger nucleic acid-binding protein
MELMNCHNCEIELEWDGFSPIVLCDICRAYRFVDVPDVTANQIISLNQPGSGCCPCCRRRLTLAAMDGLKVEQCAECAGVLLDDEVFAMFVRNRRIEFREAASQPLILVPVQQQPEVNCPRCRTEMNIHPCYGPDFIIVNSCLDCGNVWLDCRELTNASCVTN